jgi:hypothetical protein
MSILYSEHVVREPSSIRKAGDGIIMSGKSSGVISFGSMTFPEELLAALSRVSGFSSTERNEDGDIESSADIGLKLLDSNCFNYKH